jgi:DNA-binding NarL/FixJ family response regulator
VSAQRHVIRIVLVDDHPVYAEGLKEALEETEAIAVVGMARSGRQAVELIEQLQPEVIVLDLRLPGISGMAVAERTRRISPRSGILILTGFDAPESATALLRLGVRGFLSKTATSEEIASAVQVIGNGGTLLSTLIPWSYEARDRDLTPRQWEVLQLLIAGRRNIDIAVHLGIGLHTVETHVRQVLRKRGVKSRWELRGLAPQAPSEAVSPETRA